MGPENNYTQVVNGLRECWKRYLENHLNSVMPKSGALVDHLLFTLKTLGQIRSAVVEATPPDMAIRVLHDFFVQEVDPRINTLREQLSQYESKSN